MKGFKYCEFCGEHQATFLHDFEECDTCADVCFDVDDCSACRDLYDEKEINDRKESA